MSRRTDLGALLLLGAGWGFTVPLTKIAVSTGHAPLGLIFWQTLIGAAVLGALRLAMGKTVRLSLPLWRTFLLIACLGTVLPNSFSYLAARQLPAGVMGIVISLVPVFAFPVALVLGNDRFGWRRLLGLLAGGGLGLLYPMSGALACAACTLSLWAESTGRFSLFRRVAPKSPSYNLLVPMPTDEALGTVVISAPLDAPAWRPDSPKWVRRPLKAVLGSAVIVTRPALHGERQSYLPHFILNRQFLFEYRQC